MCLCLDFINLKKIKFDLYLVLLKCNLIVIC